MEVGCHSQTINAQLVMLRLSHGRLVNLAFNDQPAFVDEVATLIQAKLAETLMDLSNAGDGQSASYDYE